MKLSKSLGLLLAITVLAWLAVACGSESKTVKIGLLSPQTGPIAQYAPGFADAANVAMSELNVTHEGNFLVPGTKLGNLPSLVLLGFVSNQDPHKQMMCLMFGSLYSQFLYSF